MRKRKFIQLSSGEHMRWADMNYWMVSGSCVALGWHIHKLGVRPADKIDDLMIAFKAPFMASIRKTKNAKKNHRTRTNERGKR